MKTDIILGDKLAKSIDIIIEMLNDRGYPSNLSSGQIMSFLKAQINKSAFQIVLDNDYRVIYQISEKPLWRDIQQLFLDKPENIKYTILVLQNPLSNKDMNKLNNIENDSFKQVFLLKELQFNVTKHILVPKHEIIKDASEVQKIMKEMSVTHLSQFPIILKSDPVSKWLWAKSGDLIRITRPSETSGIYIAYRHCI